MSRLSTRLHSPSPCRDQGLADVTAGLRTVNQQLGDVIALGAPLRAFGQAWSTLLESSVGEPERK